ncbi:MAG: fumarate hydratase C-terminal domain-containing protein [Candidatus Omnitrophica bacterium]|nr:fumarate hydratase C-terminal domain-containing protein [Candidatus Omnitrophota bacterium]
MELKTPLSEKDLISLKAGQVVLLNGTVYTARDRAHQRFIELLGRTQALPLDLKNKIIYYCGPNIKGDTLGACGPTTASRMDVYMKAMYIQGVAATIGKGQREPAMRQLCKEYKRVYFVTHAGCAAYLRNRITSYRLIAFGDLGAEAVFEFEVEKFPLIVAIDTQGNDIYERLGTSSE